MAAVEGTSNWRTSPASVFTVTVAPLIAVMVPKKRVVGACARARGAARKKATNTSELIESDLRMVETGMRIFMLLSISLFSTDRIFPVTGAGKSFPFL
jgi:hypothetical protein